MTGITSHWYLLLILLIIVLIIWGPGKLPDVGAGMGRAIREFRKASSETKDAFTSATSGTDAPSATGPAAATAAATPVVTQPATGAAAEQPVAETPKQETPASS